MKNVLIGMFFPGTILQTEIFEHMLFLLLVTCLIDGQFVERVKI